jgi:hypothetical protein
MASISVFGRNARVETKGMVPFLILLTLAVGFGLPSAVVSQQVEIDMDRNTGGIQAFVSDYTDARAIEGAVVVTNCNEASRYAVQLLMTNSAGGNSIVCTGTSASAGVGRGNVADGSTGVSFVCNDGSVPNSISRANLSATDTAATGGQVTLFHFNLELSCQPGQNTLVFQTSNNDSTLGVNVNGEEFTFGPQSSNPIPTVGGADFGRNFTRCYDTVYYILDGLGGRHPVPPSLRLFSGPVYFGVDVAKDMEMVDPSPDPMSGAMDILVLDRFGGASFVEDATHTPAQGFMFPDGTSQAVDVALANGGEGFWVLRADGRIYAAGSTLAGGADGSLPVAQTPVALDFPFGGTVPRNSNPLTPPGDPDASIRAVGFAVVQSADPLAPTGFVVLDSQGGHYILTGSGAALLDDDTANSILNGPGGTSETVYPFWQGLDIGRDIELHPDGAATDGVGIYDGFGGVHPVPVNNPASGVQFLRNDGTDIGGVGASTVGLPYLTIGFDDPATAQDEADTTTFGVDSHSIFKDLEFCTFTGRRLAGKCGSRAGGGVYVLDGFGGVFVLGNTRQFTGGPYFFPNPIVRDLEPAYVD